MSLPRDLFIDEIFSAALLDENICFLNADLGAKSLDRFREELPGRFFHCGISEQNMMDVAAGLAQNGKSVFTYAMAPFITFRCFEQIKVALASMNLPVTIVGVGVGYGYEGTGPTHYATEDLTCMRVLGNMEILSPADAVSVVEAARLTLEEPKLRYIRLDRKALPDIHTDPEVLADGVIEVKKGRDLCLIGCGYTVHQCLRLSEALGECGVDAGVVDVFRVKSLNTEALYGILSGYAKAATYEEHFLSGGLGSLIAEAMMDGGILKPLKRIGIPDVYVLDNGSRDHVQRQAGMDYDSALAQLKDFMEVSP